MYTNKKRTVIVIIISVLMNLSLFMLSYFLKLPLWLDTTGTIYASIILGFPVGFFVAIINNVMQSLFVFELDSLSFYLVSAITAFVSGTIMKKYRNKPIGRWFLLLLGLLVVSVTLAVVVTFVSYEGIPSDHWGMKIYYYMQSTYIDTIWPTIIAVSSIKVFDIVTSVIIVCLSYRLTPLVIRDDKTAII